MSKQSLSIKTLEKFFGDRAFSIPKNQRIEKFQTERSLE